jgi:hypothetical protein
MNITRTSQLTGITRTIDIPISSVDLRWLNNPARPPIQELFPNLSPDEHEFLLTGITPEEWDKAFGPAGRAPAPESPVQTSNTTTNDEQAV